MDTFRKQIEQGENYFGSGSRNTPTFKSFATKFKNKLVKELKKVADVSDKKIDTGHFYISGFITVNGQVIYVSISDVRHGFNPQLLVRTAKDYKDFTGGSNNYVNIDNNIGVNIVRTLRL